MIEPVFLIFYLLLAFFGFFQIFAANQKYKAVFYSLSILLFLIAGIRYETGADYNSYKAIFYSIKQEGGYFAKFLIERGYFILNYFFRDVEYGFEIVLLIVAYLGVILKANIFFKYGVFPFLSLLLYYQSLYLTGEFAQIRQSVATSFTMIALPYAIERRFVKFVLITLLAFYFHVSAGIFFITYFIVNMDLKGIKKQVFMLLFLMVFILSHVSSLTEYLLEKLDFFLFGEYINQKFHLYLNNKQYGNSVVFTPSEIIRIMVSLFVLSRDFRKYEFINERYYKAISNLYLFGTFLFYLLKSNEIFAARLTAYFKIYDCLLIPLLLFVMTRENKSFLIRALGILLFFAYSFFIFIKMTFDDKNLIYKTIFAH